MTQNSDRENKKKEREVYLQVAGADLCLCCSFLEPFFILMEHYLSPTYKHLDFPLVASGIATNQPCSKGGKHHLCLDYLILVRLMVDERVINLKQPDLLIHTEAELIVVKRFHPTCSSRSKHCGSLLWFLIADNCHTDPEM